MKDRCDKTKLSCGVMTLLLFLTILCSCSPEENSIREIDLTQRSGGRILHLDELMTDFRLVRLETDKDILIPQYFGSFVGEKYILILAEANILQFDKDGNLIRILANQGKGPGEYMGTSHFEVDENESKFYFLDWGNQDYMSGYNLDTGEALPKIELPYNDVSTFTIADDHILFVSDWSSSRELYTLSFDGELLDTLSNLKKKNYTSDASRGDYLKNLGGRTYYLDQETDSLFLIDGVEKSSVYYFKVDDRYDFETNQTGNVFTISAQTENKFMLSVLKIRKRSPNSVSRRIESSSIFLWNNQDKTADYISGFFHSYFELEVEGFPIETRAGVSCLSYSAFDFKEMLAMALENKELNPEKADRFRELDAMISEEDNPILLIGKMVD